MGTVSIPLNDNRRAVIDAADFERVNAYCWHYHEADIYGSAYVFRNVDGRTAQRLECFLLGLPPLVPWVRFKNGDVKDCRRANMEVKRG